MFFYDTLPITWRFSMPEHSYDNPHPLGHPIDGHEQEKKSKNTYSPTFPKEMYEKRSPRVVVTGFEMTYPKEEIADDKT